MASICELKRFVYREATRENGNIERAYSICKQANQQLIIDSKKESGKDSKEQKKS